MEEWKHSWKKSTDATKQRKYRDNAPYHHRNKFLSATLSEDVEERVGTGTLPVRKGDKAEIMRGDFAGLSGQVERVDYEDYTVYISGIDTERVDGTETDVPLDPSNIKLTRLELSDTERLSSYEVTQEDRTAIKVEEDLEEAEEVEDESEDTSDDHEDNKEQDGSDEAEDNQDTSKNGEDTDAIEEEKKEDDS